MTKQKRGYSFKQFSFEDRQTLEKLLTENPNITLKAIGEILGRGVSGISMELNRIPNSIYSAVKAQEDADLKKHIKAENTKKHFVKCTTLEERITFIEMQLEILIETLKELKND